MPSITLTIAELTAPAGRSPGQIKGTDGKRLTFWQDKAHLFQIGKTYEIEYAEKASKTGGQPFLNVIHAKEVGAPAAAATSPPKGEVGYHRETSDKDAERMFVCSILGSFIESGQVTLDKEQLWNATKMLRLLWLHTFGPSGQLAGGLASQALVARDEARKNGASDAYAAHNGKPVDELPEWAH